MAGMFGGWNPGAKKLETFNRKPFISSPFRKSFSRKHGFGKGITIIPRFSIANAILIIAGMFLLYFFRPWFHDFVMGFYTTPIMLVVAAFMALSIMFLLQRKEKLAGVFGIITIILLAIFMFNDILVQLYVVHDIQYNKISMMPDSTIASVRILPRAVATRFMEDSLQKSMERIGPLDFISLNNNLVWTAPRVPNGFILYLTKPVEGLMTADALSSVRQTKLINQELKVGEMIGITDSIYWQLYKREYFMNDGDIYYVLNGSDIITVIPIIRYRFKFPVMVPYYGGVYLVDKDGNFEYKSPEEISNIPYLQGNRAFPKYLARLYVDSYKYHFGLLNAWFFHKDQIEITDVYGQGDLQPFLLPTTQGLKWILATEPYGESYGVFKIFFVDAVTGKIEMMELNEDQTLTGPVRVVSYVKKTFPRIDWNSAMIVEPRPVIIKGVLFWMLSITPIDSAGISYTVFVNSENNEVNAFDKDADVFSFVNGVQTTAVKEAVKEQEVVINQKTLIEEKIKSIERTLNELKALVAQGNSTG